VRKVAKLNLVGAFPPSAEPEERESKEEMGYTLTGITSGLVMKRTRVNSAKTCGLLTQD
jgi:hypothetical protein